MAGLLNQVNTLQIPQCPATRYIISTMAYLILQNIALPWSLVRVSMSCWNWANASNLLIILGRQPVGSLSGVLRVILRLSSRQARNLNISSFFIHSLNFRIGSHSTLTPDCLTFHEHVWGGLPEGGPPQQLRIGDLACLICI